MQRRLVRKLDLELLLSKVGSHPCPNARLEQYPIPVNVAAAMLYMAAYANNDIVGKTVVDLGCGTGRLALGAAFLGAKSAVGLDIDREAIETAVANSVTTGLKKKVDWVIGDLEAVHGHFDTVLQNPPFGVQKRMADRRFVQKALELGKTIYSLHKDPGDGSLSRRVGTSKVGMVSVSPGAFLRSFVEEHGGKVRDVYAMLMEIPHMFSFHAEKKHGFIVDLYILDGKSQS